ncbi:MAG TPA: hypothetical protein VMZ27_02270, partial [Candidatus Saccharimonadales bacterium]|nr:hypothetical protein [Candidatus Saccharimonadales bacterium]
ALISWLSTWNGLAAKSMFSMSLIPGTSAALVMVACIRVLFASPHANPEPPHAAAQYHRSFVVVSAILIITVGVSLTSLLLLHRKINVWDNVEVRLRQVVMADERFRYVRVDRARDGSVFLYGAVESSESLDALQTTVANARFERTPSNVVTISGPFVTSGSPLIRTPLRRH